MIMIASKNGMVASNQATAYCAAKAAEIQLSRSFALEGAPLGIRSNVVNPDAVIRGSKIWTGKWSEERAAANKIGEGIWKPSTATAPCSSAASSRKTSPRPPISSPPNI